MIKRRMLAVLTASMLLVAMAAPALAQSPKDAKGCENTKAGQLAGYCETS